MHEQHETEATLAPSVGEATEFDLARAAQSDAAGFDTALARNRAFAAAGEHEGATGLVETVIPAAATAST